MSSKKKTILFTSIICGIFAIFILIIFLLGLFFFIFRFSAKNSVSSVTSDSSASDITSASTQTLSSVSSEISVEEPEVIPEPIEWVSNEVYGAAYKNILSANSYSIANYYYWQFEYEELAYYPYFQKLGENPCIAFSEITGDNIPEMFFVNVPAYQGTEAQITIYTLEEDRAKDIFSIYVDSLNNDGNDYILFKNYRGDLYLYTESHADLSVNKYTKIYQNSDGTFVSRAECVKKIIVNPHSGEVTEEYVVSGTKTTKDDYDDYVMKITKNGVNALLYDSSIDTCTENWIESSEKNALVVGDAISFLTKRNNVPDGELPIYDVLQMDFSSGAGGWGTYLELLPDGTFSASYHDSDMGDTGAGYDNGTVYYGSCFGLFTDIKQIDEYTYSMTLKSKTEEASGDPYIEESILWIPTETYGVDCGEIFLYLPGKPISDIPEECLFWGYAFYSDITRNDKLPCFVLYNVETGNAFYN